MLEKILKNAPMSKVVAMGVGAGVSTATALFVLSRQPKPSTMTPEWNAATKDYRRYQKMDDIGMM